MELCKKKSLSTNCVFSQLCYLVLVNTCNIRSALLCGHPSRLHYRSWPSLSWMGA